MLALTLDDRDGEVILDDRDAKRCAQTLGISARGTLGLVLLAKQLGEVSAACQPRTSFHGNRAGMDSQA